MRIRFLTLALAGFLVLTSSASSRGGSATTQLQLRATVATQFEYHVLSQISEARLTPADVRKGKKDIANGTTLSVTTNSTAGYLLVIQWSGVAPFKSITGETNGGATFSVDPNGVAELHVPHSGSSKSQTKISYRLNLTPDTVGGVYPWPLTITAQPL